MNRDEAQLCLREAFVALDGTYVPARRSAVDRVVKCARDLLAALDAEEEEEEHSVPGTRIDVTVLRVDPETGDEIPQTVVTEGYVVPTQTASAMERR